MIDSAWWRSAVIYQIYPRSFADADGDGLGDLPGITGRLPYVAALGVDAMWLSPFYRSPMVDGGYDVADYRDVDPRFGTLADFDALVGAAHGLGLRVIVDVVPNHSSSAHPWFVDALGSDPSSRARDRYHFVNGLGPDGALPPNNWRSVFGGPAWTRVGDGQWYLHLFDPAQPDFNWHNEEVRAEFAAILRFWLDRGVDGFRVDVAHGLIKADGLPDRDATAVPGIDGGTVPGVDGGTVPGVDGGTVPYFDQDGVHEIYRDWRKILDSYPGERIAVAEVFDSAPARVARYVAGDELHQAFNFDFLEAPWQPDQLRKIIDVSLDAAGRVGASATWVLSNHDRQRHVTRFGDGALGTRRARAAVLLMLALPGSAYLYQGEELGLPEVLDLPAPARQDPLWLRSGGAQLGRDGCRVPLPWSGSAPSYGFGPGNRSWLPQPAGWAQLSVAAQEADPASMLSLYRQALLIRRTHPALRAGRCDATALDWLDAPDGVLAWNREPGLVCAVNLSTGPVRLPGVAGLLLASGPLDGHLLPPDTAAWYTPTPATPTPATPTPATPTPATPTPAILDL